MLPVVGRYETKFYLRFTSECASGLRNADIGNAFKVQESRTLTVLRNKGNNN